MKIVCPCRNLRLGKTVRDAENRSLPDDEPRSHQNLEKIYCLLILIGQTFPLLAFTSH